MTRRSLLCVIAALSSTLLEAHAHASITLPESARIAPPVDAPLFRAACAHYWNLRENSDGMGNDNHTPLGLEFLLAYAQHPPASITVPDALRALPTIDLAHHRRGCYSNGETPGGAVWPLDTTAVAAGVVTIRGFLNVRATTDAPIDWTLALAANDATRVRIGGRLVLEAYWSDSTRWKKFAHLRFPRPGVYALEIDNATNHVCNLDPVELYYAPGWIADLDGACACGAGCAFDSAGCSERTPTIVSRGPFRLIDSELLMARPDGSQPPSLDQCTVTTSVVDPSNPERFVACVSDRDCAAPTPVCDDDNTCVSGCGNARIDMGETCDDGDSDDGDGCDHRCLIEPGHRCIAPSNIVINSSFEEGTAGWTAGGTVVEVARESERGGVQSGNFVAEIDRSPSWAGGARQLAQDLTFAVGTRYSISARYARALDAPSVVGALVEFADSALAPLAISATGPTVFRSTIRTFTASSPSARLSLRFDPAIFTSESPHGLLVDDVAVHRAGRCEALDSDADGVPDPVEIARGTNPRDPDTDHDSIRDPDELGASPEYLPIDHDSDGRSDANDPDDDGDGLPTVEELGADGFARPRNTDEHTVAELGTSDEMPDYLDPDDDGDSIPTSVERTLERAEIDGDDTPAWYDLDSDGDGVPDRVEAGDTANIPANSDRDLELHPAPDFLDVDSDNDCLPDSDARETLEARVDPARPNTQANDNCPVEAPVCQRAISVCVAAVGFATSVDQRPRVVDAGTDSDASARTWTLSGDGACACRSSPGRRASRATSPLVIASISILLALRRARRR